MEFLEFWLDMGFRVDGVGEDGDGFECVAFKWTTGHGFFFFFLGDWVQLWFLRVRDLDGFN